MYGSHLPDDVVSALEGLRDAIEVAMDADNAEDRLDAIGDAREYSEQLQDNDAFNPTFSSGLRRQVDRMLDVAEDYVSDA